MLDSAAEAAAILTSDVGSGPPDTGGPGVPTDALDLAHCDGVAFMCVRAGVLGLLFAGAGAAAGVQAVRTALVPTARLRFQLGVLAAALAECAVGATHYLFHSAPAFRFVLM
jgi:hypothetical protein